MSNDLISAMPAARSYAGVMMLIPSTTMQAGTNLDIQVTPGMLVFGGAGGRNNESRIQVDGLNTGAAFNGAGVSSYVPDISNAQEIATTTSGGMGEAEVGGPSFSIVPKTGGNTFKGSVYASNVTSGMVGDNYTDDLKARGLTTPGALSEGVGLQRRPRRPDQQGPRLVFRAGPRRRQSSDGSRHVRQQELRRPDEMDVCGGHEPAGGPGRELADRIAPSDRAAHRRATSSTCSGTSSSPARERPRWARRRMQAVRSGEYLRRSRLLESLVQRDRRARNGTYSTLRATRAAGDLDVAGVEPVAARSRGRDYLSRWGGSSSRAISRR